MIKPPGKPGIETHLFFEQNNQQGHLCSHGREVPRRGDNGVDGQPQGVGADQRDGPAPHGAGTARVGADVGRDPGPGVRFGLPGPVAGL